MRLSNNGGQFAGPFLLSDFSIILTNWLDTKPNTNYTYGTLNTWTEDSKMTYIARKPFSATVAAVIGTVSFTNGLYRGKPFSGEYDLVKGYQDGGNGEGFVTIREANGKKTRITVGADNGYSVTLAGDTEGTESVEASRLLTYVEAAEILGTSKDAIRKRVGRGTLQGTEVDGVKYVTL